MSQGWCGNNVLLFDSGNTQVQQLCLTSSLFRTTLSIDAGDPYASAYSTASAFDGGSRPTRQRITSGPRLPDPSPCGCDTFFLEDLAHSVFNTPTRATSARVHPVGRPTAGAVMAAAARRSVRCATQPPGPTDFHCPGCGIDGRQGTPPSSSTYYSSWAMP